jgi:hypothetical protein
MINAQRIISRTLSAPVLVLSLIVVGGCGKSDAPPKESSAPQAGAPAAPAPQAAFRVTRIDLGNAVGPDKKVAAPAVAFKPGDTIFASILTEGAAANVVLKARWTFEGGQLVNESTQTISPTGPAATEFHIAKPDGWPAGKYKVEIAANGQPAGAADFTVTEPG